MASNKRLALKITLGIVGIIILVGVIIKTIKMDRTPVTPVRIVEPKDYEFDIEKFARVLADSLNKDLGEYGLYYEIEVLKDDIRFNLKSKWKVKDE